MLRRVSALAGVTGRDATSPLDTSTVLALRPSTGLLGDSKTPELHPFQHTLLSYIFATGLRYLLMTCRKWGRPFLDSHIVGHLNTQALEHADFTKAGQFRSCMGEMCMPRQ